MATPRGKYRRLSLARRMIGDFLAISQPIPVAYGERRMDLGALREAVSASRPRPTWPVLFFKAWAIVSADRPALRQAFLPLPWPRLYEHPEPVGSMVMTREIDGEPGLFFLPIASPQKRSLVELEEKMRWAKRAPLHEVPSFRRQLRLARIPWPFRRPLYRLGRDWSGPTRVRYFGTFGVTALASLGIATISTPFPWPSMIYFTPFDDRGMVTARVGIDHRVFDGVESALALRALDDALLGPILDEVRKMAPPRGLAAA